MILVELSKFYFLINLILLISHFIFNFHKLYSLLKSPFFYSFTSFTKHLSFAHRDNFENGFKCRLHLLSHITFAQKYLGQLNRKPHARFLLPLPCAFFSLPSSLPNAPYVAMIGALYVHKNQISLFVICNFLSFFILYVNGQSFYVHFYFVIYKLYVYIYLAEVRALFWLQC